MVQMSHHHTAITILMTATAVGLWRRARETSRRARVAEAVAAEAAAVAAAAAVVAALEIERLRTGLDALARSSTLELWVPVPEPLMEVVPTPGWSRCLEALAAARNAYFHQKRRETRRAPKAHKKILMSSFDCARGGGPEKRLVDDLLATHATQTFPDLPALLRGAPNLVLLLLEAPSCATTSALVERIPGLRDLGLQICVPQADPAHYAEMITTDMPKRADVADLPAEAAAALPVAAVARSAGKPRAAGEGAAASMLLNVRCQRLDQWLTSTASFGLRVPIFFADYETSVYGRINVELSPLLDLQRFIRGGFAHLPCLLGITLSYRTPHERLYHPDAPQLTPEDLMGFVAAEATAQGLESTVLEQIKYGMTFTLFKLHACKAQ